jgi:hypothetical protein
MEIAHIQTKRSVTPQYVGALLCSNLLAWLLFVPRNLISGTATQLIEWVPNKHYMFRALGEFRLLLSFLNGVAESASIYTNYALGQPLPCPTRPVRSKQLKNLARR